MNKQHPNEIILNKLTPDEMEKLMWTATALSPKHSDVLEVMARRQKDYVFDEPIVETEK